MRNRRFPRYPNDTDYTTNSPSYYDDLARKNKLIRLLSEKIWEYEETLDLTLEEINQRLTDYINENDELMTKRLEEWDLRLEKFPENVELLLQEWLSDGTLDHIINETIFSWKADKTYVDSEIERLEQTDDNIIEQLTQKAEQVDLDHLEKKLEQKDYVEILKKYNDFPYMQMQKVNRGGGLEVTLYNDQNEQITLQFLYNGRIDDYLIHTRTWYGTYEKRFSPYKNYPIETLNFNGNFTQPSTSKVAYTSTVGDSFTGQVTIEEKGDALTVMFYSDSKGGVWEISIDGYDSERISTYDKMGGHVEKTMFKDIEPGNYTVTATFIGDDQNNVPSDGVGTSRGWVASSGNNVFMASREFAIPEKSDEKLIKPPSNLEFAYNIRPTLNDEYEMIPYHGNKTSFKQHDTFFYDDNKLIDFDNMDNLSYVNINGDLIIQQKIWGRHSSRNDNLLEISTYQTIKKDGRLVVDGRMKTLQDIYFTNSYVIMGAATGSIFNEIQTSMGNTYPNTSDQWLSSTKSTPLVDEGADAKSFLFLSSGIKNLAIGYTIHDLWETLRLNENDIPPHEHRSYIYHRDEGLVKIYTRLWGFDENLVKAGYVHRFSGEYIFSTNKNMYDILSLK